MENRAEIHQLYRIFCRIWAAGEKLPFLHSPTRDSAQPGSNSRRDNRQLAPQEQHRMSRVLNNELTGPIVDQQARLGRAPVQRPSRLGKQHRLHKPPKKAFPRKSSLFQEVQQPCLPHQLLLLPPQGHHHLRGRHHHHLLLPVPPRCLYRVR